MAEVRRIAGLLRPHAAPLALALVVAGVLSGCQALLVILVKRILHVLFQPSPTTSPWLFGAAIILLFLVQGGARVLRTWLTRRAALCAERDLRNRLFAHLLRCPPALLHERGLGDCLSRISHDAGTIRTAVGAAVTLVQRPMSALAIGGTAAFLAPKLALWASLGLPAVVLVIYKTGRATRHYAGIHLRQLAGLESHARDGVAGLRTIQAYGAEQQAAAEFERRNEGQFTAALQATLRRISGPPLVELAAATAMAVVVVVGASQVRDGELEAASLVAFLVALGLLGEPLKGVAAANALWEEARAGLRRVFELLDIPISTLYEASRDSLESPVSISLQRVCLDRGRGPILQGVDLVLKPGQVVVVQGASGVGKSTILDLIAGFVEPTSGSILWNGLESKSLSLGQRRSCIALVDQESWLGMGSVRDAIALARPGASQEEVARCAERAGLPVDGPFLGALPGGLEGRVGDAGAVVSGGERQRISLARALLRDAPILLLDEPTANLDTENELSFLQTLSALRGNRSILIVSHRSAPLDFADRSYRLDGGVLLPLSSRDCSGVSSSLRRPTGSDSR